MEGRPLLSLRDLSLSYRSEGGVVQAVDRVSFDLARGETLVLLGESGCGKSSLARALLRLLPRNIERVDGEIELDGLPLHRFSDERFRREVAWQRISLVMQAAMNALNPVVRVGEQVAEPLRLHFGWSAAQARQRVVEVFSRVGVPVDFADRYPFELSGGMRQRVVLAMALATRPALVVLDEPTSALDILTQTAIMNLLKRIQREEGTSFLLITHDVAISSELADRVAVMAQGRVVELTDAATFYHQPSHAVSQRLLASLPERQSLKASPPHDATAPLVLQASALVKRFEVRRWGLLRTGEVRAVDGIDLAVRRGEAVAVVGESGSGKSSLVRTLLGLHPPDGGQITFDGLDLRHLNRAQRLDHRARVGFVQQDPYGALPPFMDVRRLLAEPLIVHGVRDRAERERRIRAVLEEVRLQPVDDFLERFPHQLSGGQQQRVVIARALILEPALLIADEPVSMLDAPVRVELLDLLNAIRRDRSLALLFITHDLATVRHHAERLHVMYAGRVVEEGPTEELLQAPRHPYTRALLAALPTADADNAKRYRTVPPGEPPSLLNPPAGCHFHPRCERAIAGRCDRDAPELETQAPTPTWRVACWNI